MRQSSQAISSRTYSPPAHQSHLGLANRRDITANPLPSQLLTTMCHMCAGMKARARAAPAAARCGRARPHAPQRAFRVVAHAATLEVRPPTSGKCLYSSMPMPSKLCPRYLRERLRHSHRPPRLLLAPPLLYPAASHTTPHPLSARLALPAEDRVAAPCAQRQQQRRVVPHKAH